MQYGKPFNHNRPFGEVHGDGRYAFDQDGQLYNVLKQPVDGDGKLMPLPPRNDAEIPVTTSEPITAESPEDDIPADEKPIDLLAWANGDPVLKATPWHQVCAQIAAQITPDKAAFANKATAIKTILDHFGQQ